MVKKNKVVSSMIVSASLVAGVGMAAYAVPERPSGEGGEAPSSVGAPGDGQGGASASGGEMATPGGSSSASVSYSGATTFSADTTASEATYSSSTGGQNALLISGGKVELKDVTITKSGDESSESSDFYGTNAGILVYNGASLDISNATISTGGAHANAVFSYGEGAIAIADSKITTTGNNSGGIMVTGGGMMTANNVEVETSGNSSAAIRSDRGGGTMTISEGSYKTSGVGSPAIYSTANVNVGRAKLEATASEGVVIEGSNSVSLYETELTDTNTTLNGNSETYKNVFIYQSMSGDAEEGEGDFYATRSTLTTNRGDVFFVTNTTAVINLEDNVYNNNDAEGAFLRAQAGKWGTSGQNGGVVSLNLTNDEVRGNIVLDDISSLTLNLAEGSYLRGAMTGGTKNVKISDAKSVWVLEGDVELEFLEDEDATFQNIYANGHKLTVSGETVPINEGTPPEGKSGSAATVETATNSEKANEWLWIVAVILGTGVLAVIITMIVMIATYGKPARGEERVAGGRSAGRDGAADAGAAGAAGATKDSENMVK